MVLIADPADYADYADYADGNIKLEKYSSMEIKNSKCFLYVKITVGNLVNNICLCYNSIKLCKKI